MSQPIALSRHPSYGNLLGDFQLWRETYEAGDDFLRTYLYRSSSREDTKDFETRRTLTPIPSFASAAINRIRNSIFQRMVDIIRNGGSSQYQQCIAGKDGGVDRKGSTMNSFLGQECLTDLLVMGMTGIFVDNSGTVDPIYTAAPAKTTPYVYSYRREDILNWSWVSADKPGQLKSILLRDRLIQNDPQTDLPLNRAERLRLVWLEGGRVNYKFMDESGSDTSPTQTLPISRIPFVLLDIKGSLIKPVCRHQVALLNLASSDVWYAWRSNFPFYVEQQDLQVAGVHLKQVATTGDAQAGGQGAKDKAVVVGVQNGRVYGKGLDAPGFIHPSPEPLEASMALQKKLENDINRLVNLAVAQAGQQSAESKKEDESGLEAGLSFIGLVLENAERQIAELWAGYESTREDSRKVATIKYPDTYALKDDSDRIKEAGDLGELMYSLPSNTAKREVAKQIGRTLLNGKVGPDVIEKIEREVDEAPYLTSDPDTITTAVEAGLCGEKTGSMALGFGPEEYKTAREDHALRAARVAQAQASVPGSKNSGTPNPAARGNPDGSADPAAAANAEKAGAKDNRALDPDNESTTRGEA